MVIWLKNFHYRDQEEKKFLIWDQWTILNYILGLPGSIRKEEKEGMRDDYVGMLWEGV